jgi:hypothetical protein
MRIGLNDFVGFGRRASLVEKVVPYQASSCRLGFDPNGNLIAPQILIAQPSTSIRLKTTPTVLLVLMSALQFKVSEKHRGRGVSSQGMFFIAI